MYQEQPFQWKTSQQNCGEGLGCQETVIITQNSETGPTPDLQPLPWRVPLSPHPLVLAAFCGLNSEDRSPKYQEAPTWALGASLHPSRSTPPPDPGALTPPWPASLLPSRTPPDTCCSSKAAPRQPIRRPRVTRHRAGPRPVHHLLHPGSLGEDTCNDLSTSSSPGPRSHPQGAGGGEKGTARRRGAVGLRGWGEHTGTIL